MKILILNAGSSSQKSCLYEFTGDKLPDNPPEPIWEAQIDWTGKIGVAVLKVETTQGAKLEEQLPVDNRQQAIGHMLDNLYQGDTQVMTQLSEISMVGHRVVHGGDKYSQATLITPEVKAAIGQLAELAPEHNPLSLEGIEAIENLVPSVPQVAVFDTAFHSNLPLAAMVYPGPYEWFEQGIRRYGFHGISHRYVTIRAAQLLGKELQSLRLISCHLGNGCSLAAVREGVCVDTTMGYTPLEGLMMGSRSGSIDPGILIHLLNEGYDAEKLNDILNHHSGLKGISGVSGDMRQISQLIEQGNSRAQLAFDVYIHRLRAFIGAMLPALEGVDALIFTAGVGENHAATRTAVCAAFAFLGWQIDEQQNLAKPKNQDIATADSTIRILVIHTEEDWAIAQECWHLCRGGE